MAEQPPRPSDETPVLDVPAAMTAASLERARLDAPTLLLVRLAALVASDAPPLSYLLNLRVAGEVGVTAQQVEGVLAAVAPVVGGPRVVAAAGNIARAIGVVVAVAEAEDEAAVAAAEGAGGQTG
jgi:alkylhydroperoxidase/carboxymuconolactone decarboxylase family protein YurZ